MLRAVARAFVAWCFVAFCVGVGAGAGFVVGAAAAGLWNHFECSSVTQVLSGCRLLRPHGLGMLGLYVGWLAGLILGISLRMQARRQRRAREAAAQASASS